MPGAWQVEPSLGSGWGHLPTTPLDELPDPAGLIPDELLADELLAELDAELCELLATELPATDEPWLLLTATDPLIPPPEVATPAPPLLDVPTLADAAPVPEGPLLLEPPVSPPVELMKGEPTHAATPVTREMPESKKKALHEVESYRGQTGLARAAAPRFRAGNRPAARAARPRERSPARRPARRPSPPRPLARGRA